MTFLLERMPLKRYSADTRPPYRLRLRVGQPTLQVTISNGRATESAPSVSFTRWGMRGEWTEGVREAKSLLCYSLN